MTPPPGHRRRRLVAGLRAGAEELERRGERRERAGDPAGAAAAYREAARIRFALRMLEEGPRAVLGDDRADAA